MLTIMRNTLEYRQKQRPSVHVATTLYDLIEAVSEQVPAEEEYLITLSVVGEDRHHGVVQPPAPREEVHHALDLIVGVSDLAVVEGHDPALDPRRERHRRILEASQEGVPALGIAGVLILAAGVWIW